MSTPLQKGVRTYLKLVRAPGLDLHQPRSERYQETLKQLRLLIEEFGKHAVFAERDRQKAAESA